MVTFENNINIIKLYSHLYKLQKRILEVVQLGVQIDGKVNQTFRYYQIFAVFLRVETNIENDKI